MTVLHGEGISRGLALGRLHFLRRDHRPQPRREIRDPEEEVVRFEQARVSAIAQLGQLYMESRKTLGKGALLFQIHQLMLEDLDYRDSVTGSIRSGRINAEYAVEQTSNRFARLFAQIDDSYMRGRSADVRDVSLRVLRLLTGQEIQPLSSSEPSILATDGLAPSETACLDRKSILAFVTVAGSSNSHSAIFARALGIPAVAGLGDALREESEGRLALVDGAAGEVYLDPEPTVEAELLHRGKPESLVSLPMDVPPQNRGPRETAPPQETPFPQSLRCLTQPEAFRAHLIHLHRAFAHDTDSL